MALWLILYLIIASESLLKNKKTKKKPYAIQNSLIRQNVMRFTLTIIVIVTIIKNKHLLSDEIFMETFQDGDFLMKCCKYQ